MNLHSVFLRSDCILPSHLDPVRRPSGKSWMHVEDIAASNFDRIIRQTGWDVIWMAGSCSRRGFARTWAEATDRALRRTLNAVSARCNAAEFDSVKLTRYPGFRIARVTLERRRVQQYTALEATEDRRPGSVMAS